RMRNSSDVTMFGSSSAISTLPVALMDSGRRLAECRLAHQRQRKGEAGALARPAAHPQASAGVLDDAPADVEAEAAALRLAGERVARLAELLEDQLVVLGLHARAVVAHLHPEEALLLGERDL